MNSVDVGSALDAVSGGRAGAELSGISATASACSSCPVTARVGASGTLITASTASASTGSAARSRGSADATPSWAGSAGDVPVAGSSISTSLSRFASASTAGAADELGISVSQCWCARYGFLGRQRDRSLRLCWYRRRSRGRGLGWFRPLLHAIAERPQDRGETLAGTPGERRHADGNSEPKTVDRALGLDAKGTGPPSQRRTNQISEALQDIDAHRAFAADAITRSEVEHLGNVRIGGNRRATTGGKLLDRIKSFRLRAAVLERPELCGQHPRRGFEQRRHIDVIGAEAHPILAQRGTGDLIEALDLLRDPLPIEDAERLGELKCDATGDAGNVIGGREPE